MAVIVWPLDLQLPMQSVPVATDEFESHSGQKKNMCVYCRMSKKSRVGRSGFIFYFFYFIIIGTTGNSRSRIRFRYFIFEITGKMTNYAVFLPSLLSIQQKASS